jgi:hypothetical protein
VSSAHVPVTGTRRLIGLTPANTNEATMLTGGPERSVVVAVYIANLTAGAVNATVKWGDGTTDFAIIDTFSIAARGYLHLDVFLPIVDGGTVKVTSGTNSGLAFSLVLIEFGGALGAEHGL